MQDDDFAAWIGKRDIRRDVISAAPLWRLAATLDRDDPPLEMGDPTPALAHWFHFLPDEPMAEIGRDGHPRRGGFLPPVHQLPRRMWAGSRITFARPLRVGEEVERVSTITSVCAKTGATGPLVFVTVRHVIGAAGGPPAVIDEHDIVYRTLAPSVPKRPRRADPGPWRREVVPDPVLLFRFSALTFNGHRIHYDRDYAREAEGYSGLVVHGPLIATLLLDLARHHNPDARITAFFFRALAPAFDGEPLILNGSPPDASRTCELWATGHKDRLLMEATAGLAP